MDNLTDLYIKAESKYALTGTIYIQDRPILKSAFFTFWLEVQDILPQLELYNLSPFFYEKITDLLVKTQRVFGKTLVDSANGLIRFFTIFLKEYLSKTNLNTSILIKYSYFSGFFVETLNTLIEENAAIDSSKLLRILEFYTYTDTKVFQQKYVITSKRSLSIKRFKDIYERNVIKHLNSFLKNSQKINQRLSDTSKKHIPEVELIEDENILLETWGGEGKKVYKDLLNIKQISDNLGNSEASNAGILEICSDFCKVVNLVCFSQTSNTPYKFSILGNSVLFGKFQKIFSTTSTNQSLNGLKFLEPFLKLKSFHTITEYDSQFANIIIQKYHKGITTKSGKIKILNASNEYNDLLEIIKTCLTSIISECENLGGVIDSCEKSLGLFGDLKGAKGLGNIRYHLQVLKSLFSPVYATSSYGLNSTFEYFITGFIDLTETLSIESININLIDTLHPLLLKLQSYLESLLSTLKITGVSQGTLISDIDARLSKKSKKDSLHILSKHGFDYTLIEQLLKVESFDDLVLNLGPQYLDSQDLKSFFKCYELVTYIYTLGGSEAIEKMLDYLYSPSSITSFRRIYDFIDKNLSKYEHVNRYKLGKLLGSLLSINRGVNFSSFRDYAAILKAKNSEVLESVKILDLLNVDPLENTQIDLIADYVKSLGNPETNLDCADALKYAPLGLKRLVGIFDSSISDATLITGFLNGKRGITAKDLESVFKTQQSNGISLLGGILSGLEGGEFSRMSKALILSGALSLITPQTNTRGVITDDLFLKELFDKLENLSQLLGFLHSRLLIGFELEKESVEHAKIDLDLNSLLPPGIGNSPTKFLNSVEKLKSESLLKSDAIPFSSLDYSPVPSYYTQGEVIKNFVITDAYNEIAQGIPQDMGIVVSKKKLPSTYQVTEYEVDYQPDDSWKEKYLKPVLEPSQTIEDICRKSDLTTCEPDTAVSDLDFKTKLNDSIPIQREFKDIAYINPSKYVIPHPHHSLPSYYQVFDNTILGIGISGLPILSDYLKIKESQPYGLLYDLCHTPIFKIQRDVNHIKDCLPYSKNLSEYLVCVNSIKCKKVPHLSFCSSNVSRNSFNSNIE